MSGCSLVCSFIPSTSPLSSVRSSCGRSRGHSIPCLASLVRSSPSSTAIHTTLSIPGTLPPQPFLQYKQQFTVLPVKTYAADLKITQIQQLQIVATCIALLMQQKLCAQIAFLTCNRQMGQPVPLNVQLVHPKRKSSCSENFN
jgi:hypothetical protein